MNIQQSHVALAYKYWWVQEAMGRKFIHGPTYTLTEWGISFTPTRTLVAPYYLGGCV